MVRKVGEEKKEVEAVRQVGEASHSLVPGGVVCGPFNDTCCAWREKKKSEGNPRPTCQRACVRYITHLCAMAGAAAAAPRVLHKYTHTTFAVEFPQLTHVKAMKITSPHSPTAADMKRRVCGELLGGKTLATHGLSVEAMAQDAVLKIHVRNDVTGTTTYRDCSDNETLEGFMLQLIFRSRETTARVREACKAFANAKHEVRSEAARQAAIHVVAKKEEPKRTKVASIEFDVTAENNGHSAAGNLDIEN